MMDVIDAALELFAGNTAAIGTEEGGCMRTPFHLHSKSQQYWWADQVRGHFLGGGLGGCPPVGVYPMAHQQPTAGAEAGSGWMVKWGCIDFDEGDYDSEIHARNVSRLLAARGVLGWTEISRSKGYHVWVFADEWVPARLMRRALLGACQVVDAPTREINPKQETLAEGQLGNYVRLPYPANWKHGPPERPIHRAMVAQWGPPRTYMDFQSFVTQATEHLTTSQQLQSLEQLYVEPIIEVSKAVASGSPVRANRPAERRMNGLAWTMYQDGMLPHQDDRSAWLYSFARELAQSDLTFNEALGFLEEAHDAHAPKWAERPDRGRQQLARMMAKAAGA